ncbi:MAG: hypothetical protein ACLU7Y_06035 [Bifidobacterium longum]|uniref:hypothetical protein n=1 Tax=Bifidobacterium longum TaxID=216816 RepID=UPI0007198CAF|nr:hypothetical protein [Bifidobacterium longum]AOL10920.1 hypothetical protein B624_1475 [Bifidobacterium longum]KSA09189.1 hypothetical protein APK79_02865 [Bifidobacterium longum subsp. longum]KSA10038.1 hypothetical protein APK78_08370 [Bifidobacterium longum subsp. longum]PVV53897.1 hypothetical protein DD674_04380 [Bifidobacterium longum]
MMDERQFWDSTPSLRYVFDYARAKQVAPWATLFVVLARISVAMPPHVVTPSLVSSEYGSLNVFVGILGPSGMGKGLTTGVARSLVPDIRKAMTAQPASGEGIPAMFTTRKKQDEGDRQVQVVVCANCRALLDIPEIAVLGGNSKRQGSILIPMLTSAWSGEDLGCFTKNEANRYTVPRYGYRLSLITGVQPSNLGMILDESGTGLPQRFLFAPVTDSEAPEEPPQAPFGSIFPFDVAALPADMMVSALDTLYQAGSRYDMMDHGETSYPLTVMEYPQIAYAEARRVRADTLHGKVSDPLDAHRLGLKTKVAALLAMLDHPNDPLKVRERDWTLADYVCEKSAQFRAEAIQQAEEIKRTLKAEAIALDDDARAEADKRKAERVKNTVLNYLDKHDPDRKGIVGWRISNAARSTDRKGGYVYRILEELRDEGKLDSAGNSDSRSATWSRCDQPPVLVS